MTANIDTHPQAVRGNPRLVGLVRTYIVFQLLMAVLFAVCGYVAGRLGGTYIQAYIVGLVFGYWIWKASMDKVVSVIIRLMEEMMAKRERIQGTDL